MKKTIAILLAAALLVGTIAGCGTSSSAPVGPQAESTSGAQSSTDNTAKTAKDLNIVIQKDATSLDPLMGNNNDNMIVQNYIYDGLVYENTDGKTEPALATSWEWIDDNTLRFHLREGVQFSNGMDFTAEDVYYCLARTKNNSTSASTMDFLDIENSKVVDDLTFDMAFNYPYAPVFNTLSAGRCKIGCKAVMEEVGEEAFARAPIGTGPYKLIEWASGSYLKLEANEYYWGGEVPSKKVTLKIIGEPSSRVIELETGAADMSYYIEGSDVSRVEALENYHIETGDSSTYYLVTFSMKDELLSNKDLRYALYYAVDKQAIVDACFNGYATPLQGMYSPVVEGYTENATRDYNLEKAKEYMAKAGLSGGCEIELHVTSGSVYERMAEVLQAMWAEIGVTAKIVVADLSAYEAQNNGHYQVSIRNAGANEISNVLIIYESSFGSRIEGNDNHLDEMLNTLRQTYDTNERIALIAEINTYLDDICYSIPICATPTVYAVSNDMQGFHFHSHVGRMDVSDLAIYQ